MLSIQGKKQTNKQTLHCIYNEIMATKNTVNINGIAGAFLSKHITNPQDQSEAGNWENGRK